MQIVRTENISVPTKKRIEIHEEAVPAAILAGKCKNMKLLQQQVMTRKKKKSVNN